MKFLVSGCSFTHGADLVNGFMSPENIKQSFSAELATCLNLELVNVALSGGSNEYIFHSIVEEIEKYSDVEKVLVVWTYQNRLYWKCNNRHYFMLPSWASSMVDLENFKMHDKQIGDLWITGDSHLIVDMLLDTHKFFVNNYFDSSELSKKQAHYEICLENLCSQKNIHYSSLHANDIFKFLKVHPHHLTVDEHKQAAQFIYNKFYN
jgi:hypothetical protein